MPLESDKVGGFKLDLDTVLNTGAYPSLFANKVPLWEFSENVQFTEVGAEKIRGRELWADTGNSSPIVGLVQTQRTGEPTAYFGDLTKLYYKIDEGAVVEAGTGYTTQEDEDGLIVAGKWSFAEYGSFILATNGVDTPQIDKGSNFIDVVGMDVDKVRIFAKMGPHVLGFNTDCSDREFIWCDADNLDQWVAAADNLAGQLQIREFSTEIKAVVPLGQRLAVYGDEQMALVNYLSNDLVFGYKMALNGIGAVSQNAVVAVGRKNYGLSSQGFFMTDGAGFDYIDDPAMAKWWRENRNPDQLSKTVAYHFEDTNQVKWFFPIGSSTVANYGVSYNYEKGTWSFLSEAYESCQERNVFRVPVLGDAGGRVFLDNVGDNDHDGTAIPYTLRTKALDLGNADVIKELDSIRIGMRGQGLRYKVGWSEDEQSTITWDAFVGPIDEDNGFDFTNHRTAGRWLHIEFSGSVVDADWELSSVQIIGRSEGTR